MDRNLPGSSVHGIFQARILEWVAISFSRGLPDPAIKLRSPALQADALPSESPGKPGSYHYKYVQRTNGNHQIEHTNKEIEIIKRNQIEILELKITTNKRRNFTEGQ